MKIGKNVEALELQMRFGSMQSVIYPLLLWDGKDGATLVDAGLPGSHVEIEGHLRRLGLAWKDIRRVILTHQDIDHVGGAGAVVAASKAEVLAHRDDIPYIQGEKPSLKMDPARVEAMLQTLPEDQRERARAMFLASSKVQVERALRDGEVLPLHGGIVVIHTPGHTPGHLSLYLASERVLIAADALRAENGRLEGPGASATPDMAQATASLRKFLPFAIDRVLCYHGGLVEGDPGARIEELSPGG